MKREVNRLYTCAWVFVAMAILFLFLKDHAIVIAFMIGAIVYHSCGYVVSEVRKARREIELRLQMFYEVIEFQKDDFSSVPQFKYIEVEKEGKCEQE